MMRLSYTSSREMWWTQSQEEKREIVESTATGNKRALIRLMLDEEYIDIDMS